MPWYHAIAHYGEKTRYWWNRDRDTFVSDVLLPFVAQEVQLATRQGTSALFNFGAVQYMTVVRTGSKLVRPSQVEGKALHRHVPLKLKSAEFVAKHVDTKNFVKELRLAGASSAGRSLIQRALTPSDNKIFVVMKYGDKKLDEIYRDVYQPIARKFGYVEAYRIDDVENSLVVAEQMLDGIASSELVIVDLSGGRPNCYYEAGFAHALGKPIVFCIRSGELIHFDLVGYKVIFWSDKHDLRRRLTRRLVAMRSGEDAEETT